VRHDAPKNYASSYLVASHRTWHLSVRTWFAFPLFHARSPCSRYSFWRRGGGRILRSSKFRFVPLCGKKDCAEWRTSKSGYEPCGGITNANSSALPFYIFPMQVFDLAILTFVFHPMNLPNIIPVAIPKMNLCHSRWRCRPPDAPISGFQFQTRIPQSRPIRPPSPRPRSRPCRRWTSASAPGV
jgi:hypothetical protein